MPQNKDRYEVGFGYSEYPGFSNVFDWQTLAAVRDAAGEIMLYPEDIVQSVVDQMNAWDRNHPSN